MCLLCPRGAAEGLSLPPTLPPVVGAAQVLPFRSAWVPLGGSGCLDWLVVLTGSAMFPSRSILGDPCVPPRAPGCLSSDHPPLRALWRQTRAPQGNAERKQARAFRRCGRLTMAMHLARSCGPFL